MLKPRRQPFRREVKIDDVSRDARCDSRSKNGRTFFGRRELLTKLFIPDCPEYGRGVMYPITDKGISKAEVILIRRMSSPYPLAGSIDGGGRLAQFGFAEDRKRNGRHHACHSTGNEAAKNCAAPGFFKTRHGWNYTYFDLAKIYVFRTKNTADLSVRVLIPVYTICPPF